MRDVILNNGIMVHPLSSAYNRARAAAFMSYWLRSRIKGGAVRDAYIIQCNSTFTEHNLRTSAYRYFQGSLRGQKDGCSRPSVE